MIFQRWIFAGLMLALSFTSLLVTEAVGVEVRNCPAGMVRTAPGKQLDPTFKGDFKCSPVTSVDCGNGRSCPAGYRCRPGGGACVGPPPAGPMCRNGLRCPAGHLCHPHRTDTCYEPRTQYVCGLALCGIGLKYLSGDRCYPCYVRRGSR